MMFLRGMGRLPPNLIPDVETALAESEATFRERLTRNPRHWEELRLAIQTAMTTVFKAFHRQAVLAVQRGVLTVQEARSGAEECLEDHAHSIHHWLRPLTNYHAPQSPYSFKRYDSEDTFVFSRDMVEMMQASEPWRQLLRELSEGRISAERSPENATPLAWRDITIRFTSDFRVQCQVRGENQPPLNYQEMGFADRRNGQPRAAWETLRSLAESDGIIVSTARAAEWSKVEKRVQEIRRLLKAHFRIATDPIPYDDGAYRAQFRLECSPSYDA